MGLACPRCVRKCGRSKAAPHTLFSREINMTIVIGILAYLAIMTGIMVFFRFVRSADSGLSQLTLNAPKLRPVQVMPHYLRQSA